MSLPVQAPPVQTYITPLLPNWTHLIHDNGVSLFCGMESSHNALSTEHIGDNEYLFPHVVWGAILARKILLHSF